MADQRLKLDLEDVENLKKILVNPVADAVDDRARAAENACLNRYAQMSKELDAMRAANAAILARIESLEADRKKALIGYSAVAALAAAIIAAFIDKIKSVFTGH